MKIDLTEALSVDAFDRQIEGTLELECISVAAGTFPIVERSPVTVRLRHAGKEQLEAEAEASLQLEMPCDRCLTPVKVPFSVHAAEKLDLKDEEPPSCLDAANRLLDVDEMVFHELLIHWPAKVLCRQDCRGICPVCGADLNMGECGCDRQALDPRMAAFQDIFNQIQS